MKAISHNPSFSPPRVNSVSKSGLRSSDTGSNRNENQVGGLHCNLDCSGVRDADWDKHADHAPDTALGFVCSACLTGPGPCGRQVHCSAAPNRQMAWDLVTRDLVPGREGRIAINDYNNVDEELANLFKATQVKPKLD